MVIQGGAVSTEQILYRVLHLNLTLINFDLEDRGQGSGVRGFPPPPFSGGLRVALQICIYFADVGGSEMSLPSRAHNKKVYLFITGTFQVI